MSVRKCRRCDGRGWIPASAATTMLGALNQRWCDGCDGQGFVFTRTIGEYPIPAATEGDGE